MPEMKTVVFSERSRARVLYIEAPGCIVNIHRGLHDNAGNAVTSVTIKCDEYAGENPINLPDFDNAKSLNVRVVRHDIHPAPKDDDRRPGYCPSCEQDVRTVPAERIANQTLRVCPDCGSYTEERPASPRFGCPKCKSERIEELNIVDVMLPVKQWDEQGEPCEFGEWRTVGDTISTKQSAAIIYENEPRYQCMDCDHEFTIPEPLAPVAAEESHA